MLKGADVVGYKHLRHVNDVRHTVFSYIGVLGVELEGLKISSPAHKIYALRFAFPSHIPVGIGTFRLFYYSIVSTCFHFAFVFHFP